MDDKSLKWVILGYWGLRTTFAKKTSIRAFLPPQSRSLLHWVSAPCTDWVIGRSKQLSLKNPFWFGHSNPPNLEVCYSKQVPLALRGAWKVSIPMLSFGANRQTQMSKKLISKLSSTKFVQKLWSLKVFEKFQRRSNEHLCIKFKFSYFDKIAQN